MVGPNILAKLVIGILQISASATLFDDTKIRAIQTKLLTDETEEIIPLKVKNKICQRVSVGLRKIWNKRIDSSLNIHLIVKIGDSDKTVPKRVRDERLF